MKQIVEYLLSKNGKTYLCKEPQPGCTIEDICAWLAYMGVEDQREFKITPRLEIPEKGKLLARVSRNNKSKPKEYWVKLVAWNHQQVIFKPLDSCSFLNIGLYECKISFEKAVEIAKEMIDDPNKIIDI